MTDIHIPPAALEAGARAIREFYSDEPVAVCDGVAYKAARAAFVAMVAAWPGVHMGHQCSGCGGDPQIILPLTENPDDQA